MPPLFFTGGFGLDTHYTEWLHLTVRWLHVITGVAWIGTSFYFNWLNHAVRAPTPPIDGIAGQLMSVHGGAFYEVRKYRGAPARLPDTLHWFKWEAYSTWISGFCLLSIVYYLNPGLYLLDPGVAELSPAQGISISLLTLAGGWIVYDLLCRALSKHPTLLATLGFAGITATAYGLCHVFAPRAAYLHVGAMIGTIMAANVFFVIIPGQRQMVDAMLRGEEPDVSRGAAGSLRSLHNNYLTLPVLFIMVSNHFPMTYGHNANWAILAGLSLVGAVARHYFNLKHKGRHKVWILPAAAAGMIALALVTSPPPPEALSGPIVPFNNAHAVVQKRCLPCHSATPTFPGVQVPPLGIKYDTPEQIRALSPKIVKVAVHSQTMPLANATNMTEDERQLLGQWIAQGAVIPETGADHHD